MANALFTYYKQEALDGNVSWTGDTIRALFVDHADDTPAPATDQDLADIGTSARVPAGTDGTQTNHPALGSKTKVDGVADAADTTFSALTGDVSESIVVYQSTLTDTSSILIVFFDTATGLPFTPNGGDAIVQWQSTSPKIFAL